MSAKIAAIYSAIEFVEEYLRDEISVGDIAVSAGYSLYHFIRVFNQIVHHSPYDYLMRRRLSEAALELLSSDRRVIDISLDFCFKNHETFSRAFKRMLAIQPSQWRAQSNTNCKSLLPKLTLEYLEHINQKDFLQPDLEEWDEMILAGLTSHNYENLPLLRQRIDGDLGLLPLTEGGRRFYLVSTQAQNTREADTVFYGVKVEASKKIPQTLSRQKIPTDSYARFAHQRGGNALRMTLGYIHHTWLPKTNPYLVHPFEVIRFDGDMSEFNIYISVKE